MAECHPVGFQWVMEAKARGATVIHVDPRFTRTSAVADLPRADPRRAPTSRSSAALINHVLSNGRDFREYVVAYTNAATIIDEDFRDTEDLDGLFSGFDPETRHATTRRRGSTRARRSAAAARRARARRAPSSATRRRHGAGTGGRPERGDPPERDETLEHPRCVFQILKRHFARYTPEMVERGLRHLPRAVPRGGRGARAPTRAASARRPSATPSAGPSTPSACSTSAPAAILQLLLGNIGRPGGGIMALRGHASIQGSTDIPTLFNILPGYMPMPHAARTRRPRRRTSSTTTAQTGYWGNMHAVHGQPAQGVVGRRRDRRQRLLLRLPAAADRRPLAPTRRCST